jgi:ectoine hydroxylase-related dioxygenase (phytanoyl-CoA dioxygenase family)
MSAPQPVPPHSAPRLPSSADAGDIQELLQTSGVVVVEEAIDAQCLASVCTELDPWFERAQAGEGPFLGRRTRRFSALFARAPSTVSLALHPEILSAVERVLEGDPASPACEQIQINLTQAIAIEPGEPAQAVHRDETMFPVRLAHELMVNVLWTLDPFTEINGATRVAVGSHRWPKDRRGVDADCVAVPAPPGSAIIWLGSVSHGGGANRSNASRRGLIISYSLGWLAQAERLLLSIPPDTVRRLPRRLQRLIGYQVHRPNLGWVEGRDPIEWLSGEVGDLASAQDHLPPEVLARVERALAERDRAVEPA